MSTLLRRDLLRKTQKELLKECKKYKISTLGNKGDIVDRILAFHASPTAQISNDGESNKKRSRRTRSNTISETSTTDKSKLTSLSSSSSSKTPKTPKIPKKKIVKIGVRGRSQSDASFTKFSSKSKKKKKTRSVSNDTTISPTFDLSKIDEKQSLSDQFNNDTLCDAINKFDIKYNQINQITDLTLKVLGIDSILQRKTILNQIEHIQKSHNQQKSVNAPSPKTKKEKQYGINNYLYIFMQKCS